jgi:methyl-accepting chemotaxis protein/hemerythrin
MAIENVPVYIDGEEFPSNEKIRYLTVEILSKEERERIAALQERIDKLLVSGILTPEVANKMDLVLESLEKMSERIDSIRRPYDLDIIFEDVTGKVQRLVDRLEHASADVSKRLEDSLDDFDLKSDEIMASVSSVKNIRNDLNAVITGLETGSRNSQKQFAAIGEKFESALADFEDRLDVLEKSSSLLEILKEETEISIGKASEKMQSNIQSISSAAENLNSTSKEIFSLRNEIKESNIKLSILVDSTEQKISEFSDLLDNVSKIENSIESQTASLKNIADFIREFVENAEERSGRLDSAVLDLAAFRDRLNDEMKSMLSTIEEKAGIFDAAGKDLAGLKSQLDVQIDDITGLKNNLEESANNMNRDLAAVSRVAEGIEDSRMLLSKGTEELVSAASELRMISGQAAEASAVQKTLFSEMKYAGELIKETAKSMKSFQEGVESVAKSFDRKTDDALNVMLKKTNEISRLEESVKKSSDRLSAQINSLEKIANKLAVMAKLPAKRARPKKRKARRVVKRTRSVAQRKPRRAARRKPRHVVRRTLRASPRRTARRKDLEDEALDMLIVNSLKNVSMNIDSLERATSISEKRLRARLNVLMTRGVVAREKRGRIFFYVSRVDEVNEANA